MAESGHVMPKMSKRPRMPGSARIKAKEPPKAFRALVLSEPGE
jgi:hypothetical protein